jgi:O-antigen ligase
MAVTESVESLSVSQHAWVRWARDGSFWLIVATLAWAPFPLGSNREWSWSILTLSIAFCWLPWAIWGWTTPEAQYENLRRLGIPLTLAGLTLVWATIQALPIVPSGWVHPNWPVTASLLHRAVPGVISLNPWRTLSEVTKLSTYIAVAWMVFSLTRKADRARQLLDAIIAIGAAYALYTFALGMLGLEQYALFYSLPREPTLLAGPFVLHNSFATFEGLAVLASVARLIESANGKILASKGLRRWALTTLQFTLGSGILFVIATILTISALVASASRGGAFSTLCALIAMALPFAFLLKRGAERKWALIGAGAVSAVLIMLVWISGDTLTGRIEDLIDAGNVDGIRVALWAAAQRMVTNAPYLGLGLGTFQDAYPMYATQIYPFIMDKAHSDYLEFAAGLGLPAALFWWGAMLWSAVQMGRGIFNRRKDRIYPVVGLGATILVAVHSSVDFSLQIPAVAITYAALLGIGLAQSYSTPKRTSG